MKVSFVVPGKPKGKARPKVAYSEVESASAMNVSVSSGRISAEAFRAMQSGKKAKFKGHAYTPQDTADYETLVGTIYASQVKYKFSGDLPLYIDVKAYFPIPKSTSKKRRDMMLSGEKRPTVKPDGDNILKIICDALNEIAFDDDKLLVDKHIAKWYSETPRVEVILSDEPLWYQRKIFRIKKKLQKVGVAHE